MNAKNAITNWIIDALLFGIFIILFFLDLTGLDLHQWLGIGAGALALIHLLRHRKWVGSVTTRLFGGTSNVCRAYYLLDLIIFGGFGVMIGTGLVISTWLNLALDNYEIWKGTHVLSSVITLLVVLMKVALHWKWIANVAGRFFKQPAQPTAVPAPVCQPAAVKNPGRREFLKVMGVTGAAAAFGLAGGLRSLSQLNLGNNSLEQNGSGQFQIVTNTPSGAAVTSTQPTAASQTTVMQSTAAPSAATAATATAEPAAVPTATAVPQPVTACTVRCNRGCSFPGRCRRYTDSNSNNRCDLGECM
ncbi:MAG TPA: ferric reductase-like transmembrane domain-containing protein [Anaerolineaceae bacterium]|nr:ferric reductase-like transmembrane domain-containing protein [Anaerolineaceae bacterium]HPN50553.1 ferric reductase-like transmembrane domain-containing protein [Anaerolineaceae bacterium]